MQLMFSTTNVMGKVITNQCKDTPGLESAGVLIRKLVWLLKEQIDHQLNLIQYVKKVRKKNFFQGNFIPYIYPISPCTENS